MKALLAILLGLWTSFAWANAASPLSPDKAFQLSVFLVKKNELRLHWDIAPQYYLYRDHITLETLPASLVKIKPVILPPGHMKDAFNKSPSWVYTGPLDIYVQLLSETQDVLSLVIGYQGCAEAGFCYAPVKKYLTLDLNLSPLGQNVSHYLTSTQAVAMVAAPVSGQQYAENIFNGHNFFIIVLSFLGLGLLLAFTPCVLPMVPILSGIIIGHRARLTTAKTFLLSFAYVLGMAVTYAIAGIIVALIGSRLQTELQRPWIIVLFSALFIALAFSLFGFYELQLPNAWRQRLTKMERRQKGGTYLGVFIMGGISSLIVSPCVSAPLVGVLTYIAQTGNVILGGVALLALGIGMGMPLLLLGASAGKLLPKAGSWMVTIERLMGVMMLGFAIWLLSRIASGPVTLFLWGAFCIFNAIYLGVFLGLTKKRWLQRSLSAVVFVYGIILVIGALLGNSDGLRPWENWQVGAKDQAHEVNKINIKNMQQLETQLALAKEEHQWALLDFYADWCESCVKMERTVFGRPDVQAALVNFRVLRADITQNNSFDQALLKRYKVIAPPTFLFFNRAGKEMEGHRLVGEQSAQEFLAHLTKLENRRT